MLPEGSAKAMFVIARPVPDVWRALSTPAGWKGWFAPDFSGEIEMGGKLASPSLTFEGFLMEMRPLRRLSFTWKAPKGGPAGMVTLELEHRGTSTKVTVHARTGSGPPTPEQKVELEERWRLLLKGLKTHVEASSPAPSGASHAEETDRD